MKLFNWLGYLNPIRGLKWAALKLANLRRRFTKLDYIILPLPAEMPALPQARAWWQRQIMGNPPLSLSDVRKICEQIGADPRPRGVIIPLRGLHLSLANLQTLRAIICNLRAKGKRVICTAQSYDNTCYYLASAVDEIVLQPTGDIGALGLRAEAMFLKDALDSFGLQMDSVAITGYKGALDMFTRSDMSEEGRQQVNWLLDSQYEQWVAALAEGRQTTVEAVRAFVDGSPYTAEDALAAGWVDAVENDEDLHRRLQSEHVLHWDEAQHQVFLQPRKTSPKYVALLRVAGMMIPGQSGKPPIDLPIPFIGGERAGDLTVVQQVRAVMQNKAAAAVVLFIDSGGGAVVAAEAMTAALRELAQDRPLVVYMNGVAASGGYYIATPAHWIVAQAGTITGSIGVIFGKLVTSGLYSKLGVRRTLITRGANAAWASDHAPFDDAQRTRALEDNVRHTYRHFVGLVAKSRHLTVEQVDAIGGGRVWTGAQAKTHGLVDELGDLQTALKKARELAKLPDHAPLVMMRGKGDTPLIPQLANAHPAAWLHDWQILSGTPLALLPFEVEVS